MINFRSKKDRDVGIMGQNVPFTRSAIAGQVFIQFVQILAWFLGEYKSFNVETTWTTDGVMGQSIIFFRSAKTHIIFM